jgi:hypothetical protein
MSACCACGGWSAVEDESSSSRCDLCDFAKKHPPPAHEDPKSHESDMRWGVLHNVMDNVTLCKQEEEDQHAFHCQCLRAFVLAKKKHFRQTAGCPVCDHLIVDKSKPNAAALMAAAAKKKADATKDGGDDDDAFDDDDGGIDEVGQTGGKKRNVSAGETEARGATVPVASIGVCTALYGCAY